MSEISILNGYKIKDKKATRYYDTVYDMVSDNTLKVGMHCITKGYFEVNDGGAGTYLIRDKIENETVDAGSKHDLNNGLLAELIIIDNTINVRQFGCKGDGTSDDSTAFDNALSTDYSIFIPDGTYLIDYNNISLANKTIYGNNKGGAVLKQHNSNIAFGIVGARTRLDNISFDVQNNTIENDVVPSVLEFGNSYTGDFQICNLKFNCPNSTAINGDIITDGYRVGGIIRNIFIENCYNGISLNIVNGIDRTNYFTRNFITDVMIVYPTNVGVLINCGNVRSQLSHFTINNVSVQLSVEGSIGFKLSPNAMINLSNIYTFIEGAGITAENTFGIDFGNVRASAYFKKSSIIGAIIEGGLLNLYNSGYYEIVGFNNIVGTKGLINNNAVTYSTISKSIFKIPSFLKGGKFVEDFNTTDYIVNPNITSATLEEDIFGDKYIDIQGGANNGVIEYRYNLDYPTAINYNGKITMYMIFDLDNTSDSLIIPWLGALGGEMTGVTNSAYIPSQTHPNRFIVTRETDLTNYQGGSQYKFGAVIPAGLHVKLYKIDIIKGHNTCMEFVNFD